MVTIQKIKTILEHTEARRGTISFRKNYESKVESIVYIETDDDGGGDEVFVISNNILNDGTSVLTAQEWTDLKSSLKKLYDYARDNIPGSTP